MNLNDLIVTAILKGPDKRKNRFTYERYWVLTVKGRVEGKESTNILVFNTLEKAEQVKPGYVYKG